VTDDSPEVLLSGLTARVPGARGVVLSVRGLAVAAHGLEPDSADLLAAIASGMLSAARKAAKPGGTVRQVAASLDGCAMLSVAAGTAALTVLAGHLTDMAMLGSEMADVLRDAQPFLARQPRTRGAVTTHQEPTGPC
jgi:predicted regulator of Ras-like GTPase activity (Roadblock/LC7/MglB family)